MSDFFGFTERYLSTDGKEYVDAACVREALGIVDEYVDILGVIKKLKEERDQLKEKCDKLKKLANAVYGASCGYSVSKEPAFLCDVISYTWELGPIEAHSLMDEPSYRVPNDSIRVELELTPTANYKGTIDPEDLKQYIQAYGREKKLGIVESVDYQNAKAARAELEYLYKTVLGKERLDPELSPHEVMKAILDEYAQREEFIRALSCSLGFGDPVVKPDNIDQKEKDILERVEGLKSGVWPCENSSTFAEYLRKEFPRVCKEYNVVPIADESSVRDWIRYIFGVLADYRGMHDSEWNRVEKLIKEKRAVEDSLAELRAKVREIYRSVVDDEWNSLSYTSAMNDINEEYKRVVHNFEERTADWSKAQQELDRYRLAVGSLLDIPKETRDDINAIERSFTFSKKKYESLKEFRDNVCDILNIPSSMTDTQILKEIHDIADRYDELEDFRADVCWVLGLDIMIGTTQQNDKYILEQIEKLKDRGTKLDRNARFRSNICTALCLGGETSDEDILNAIAKMREEGNKLAKLRSNICSEFSLVPENCDGNVIGHIHMIQDCHDKLREFRDDVAKAIGMDYPTTNQVILQNVKYIYKDRGDAYGMVSKLNDQVTALEKAKEELQQMLIAQSGGLGEYLKETKDILGIDSCEKDAVAKAVKDLKSAYNNLHNDYDEVCEGYAKLKKDYDSLGKAYSSVLKWNNSYAEVRRLLGVSADADADEMVDALDQLIVDREKCKRRYENWYSRYESEHERANGEHKRAEKLRKDVTVLTNQVKLLEESNTTRGNELVALQSFKHECRKLKEEKTKVIAALGQDIWDDCLK